MVWAGEADEHVDSHLGKPDTGRDSKEALIPLTVVIGVDSQQYGKVS